MQVQHHKPQPSGAGEDHISVFGLTFKRKIAAALASTILTVLAFVFLFTGYLEGGAFVSLLTLAFATGLVLLVWNRIEQFTLFGSEIKLRRLTHQAEDMLSGLDESRVDAYRTMLRLTDGALNIQQRVTENLQQPLQIESVQALVELLQSIERAELIDRLADDITGVTDKAIEQTTDALQQRHTDFQRAIDAANIDRSPREIAKFYNHWIQKDPTHNKSELMASYTGVSAAKIPAAGAPAAGAPEALEELQELLRYQRLAARST